MQGNGQLAVVEGTDQGNGAGSVWALDAGTGAVIWKVPAIGAVIGSVTTADLSGDGYQDVIVATTAGLEILDGKTGAELVHVDDGSGNGGVAAGQVYGFQNAPLVTDDPDGAIGITVAGYFAVPGSPDHDVQGMVQHFTVDGSNGALVTEAGGWPQFHHDPQLSGFAGTADLTPRRDVRVPPAASNGYLTVASDGGVFSFGGQQFCGSTGEHRPQQAGGGHGHVAGQRGLLAGGGRRRRLQLRRRAVLRVHRGHPSQPAHRRHGGHARRSRVLAGGGRRRGVHLRRRPVLRLRRIGAQCARRRHGVDARRGGLLGGHVERDRLAFGDAGFFGDAQQPGVGGPHRRHRARPRHRGLLAGRRGRRRVRVQRAVLGLHGCPPPAPPVVGMEATDDGGGYWLVAADGGVFTYGDAPFSGSEGGTRLNAPMVGIAGF